MTANRNPLTRILMERFARVLLLAMLAAGISAAPAFAQEGEDQAYKQAYNEAVEAAKAKNYQVAYEKYTEAAELAQTAGDQDVVKMSNKVLAQLDRLYGNQALKNENAEEALQHFEKGIGHMADWAPNYYGKALALKKLDRVDESMETFAQTIEVAEKASDSQVAREAESRIREQYLFMASQSLAGSGGNATRTDAQNALAHLEQMQQYNLEPDADTYYYMAEANKVLGNYDEAVTLADQALEMHRGSRSDKAKIYFTKGEALMSKGDNTAAKDAFQNAAFGSYKASAEHYLETL
jgi:tetratricopeptide (TPR) repeat protein